MSREIYGVWEKYRKEPKYYFVGHCLGNNPVLEQFRHDCYTIELVTEWRQREKARLSMSVYRAAPGWFPSKPEHFVHVSQNNPLLLAYTQNETKGEADIQTPIKPGKYLKKYYPDFTPERIADLAARWATEFTPPTLLLATTADEIERVYTNSPHSCMAYGAEHFAEFGTPFHPARIYAAGDLACAYVERDGAITARALVWPERKLAGRIYGDKVRMENALAAQGYTLSDGSLNVFDGARLLAERVHTGFVMPYVDHHHKATVSGDFLVLDAEGEVFTQPTTGNTVGSDRYCTFQNIWTSDIYNWRHVYVDQTRNRTVSMSPPRVRAQAFRCAYSDEFYVNDVALELADGKKIAKPFEGQTRVCEATGDRYLYRDVQTFDDRTVSTAFVTNLINNYFDNLENGFAAAA